MKVLTGLLVIAALAGCAVCKSSDNAEQCRTKQRDHSQSIVAGPGDPVPAPPPR